MSSEKYFLFKLVIIFVIFTVSVSSKSSKKLVGDKNSTKLVRRGLYHTQGVSRNGVTVSNVPKVRNMKRSPLSDVNVGQPVEDNTVDEKVAPGGPTVSLSIDPALETTLENAGDAQHAETIRKELMQKVLDSAMKKLKELVINKGGNVSSIPTTFASVSPAVNRATTRKMPAVARRFPTRQLSRTMPLIVRAPSTIPPTTQKAESENNTAELTTISPNEESAEHSQEKTNVTYDNSRTYDKIATVVKLPPLHMKSSKLDINYADDDKSASKEIITDVLDKDQFWRIIEDEDASLDDTEEQENEELLRMLEHKAKERQNDTNSTAEDLKNAELRKAEKATEKPFDFRVPRRLRPEVQNFINAIRNFFVNIYNSISGPWYKNLL